MSIGSSFTAPPTTRRSQLFRQQSVAAPRPGVNLGRSLGQDAVRFGNTTAAVTAASFPTYVKDGKKYTYRKNTVWVSTEDPYAKAGGLGEVTDTIPTALMLNSTPHGMEQRDIRVITPFVKAMQTKNNLLKAEGKTPFQPTNLSYKVKMKDISGGEEVLFRVWQKEEPIVGTGKHFMRYALQSPIFDEVDGLNTYDPYDKTGKSKELLMPFNRGAAKLVNYLKLDSKAELDKLPPLQAGQVAFKAFDDNRMTVIGNDHLSGSVLFQPEVAKDPNIVRGFVYHNVYDTNLPAAEAGYDQGKLLPNEMGPRDTFSPLTLAPNQANWAVIDGNFAKTILDTDFSNGDKGKQIYVKSLREHSEAGTLLNIHHPLSPQFTPVGLEFLKRDQTHPAEKKQQVKDAKPYQFETLPAGQEGNTTAAWARFKQANKTALQHKYGLNDDKDAVLMGWAARLEPGQKGFYMLKDTIEDLLKKPGNEKLQIVIAGNVGNPKDFGPREKELDAWVQEFTAKVEQDPVLKGRLYFPNRFVDKDEIAQINAACDFTMLPSLYEPYGITQLEAYKMGSIPLVHAVDGIRSSVHEPGILPANTVEERVSKFGQTGVLLKPIEDVAAYRRALSRHDLVLDFAERVAKAPGKQYLPKGSEKEIQNQYKALKTMLKELCDERNLHLPDAKKNEALPEGEEWKRQLKTKAIRFRDRLKDCEPVTEADIELLKLIEKVDQEKILAPADRKFEAAVDKAMKLSLKARQKIQENGRKYLAENHSLEAIGERWRSVLDTHTLRTPDDLEFKRPNFNNPKKVMDPGNNANQAPVKRKPVVVQKKPEGFLANAWESIKSTFSAILFYLNPMNWFTRGKA